MKCPVCGDNIPQGKSKCLRCGYECKSLATVKQDENNNKEEKRDEPESEFREVSPDDVRMSGGSYGSRNGSILDGLFGGGVFGGFTSILDDLFGFGNPFEDIDYEEYDGRDEDGFPVDVFDRDFVEISDVETFDENGNLKPDKKGNSEHRHGEHREEHGERHTGSGWQTRRDRRNDRARNGDHGRNGRQR